jgi:hypothetical protein
MVFSGLFIHPALFEVPRCSSAIVSALALSSGQTPGLDEVGEMPAARSRETVMSALHVRMSPWVSFSGPRNPPHGP